MALKYIYCVYLQLSTDLQLRSLKMRSTPTKSHDPYELTL